jgi:hypothetical protein
VPTDPHVASNDPSRSSTDSGANLNTKAHSCGGGRSGPGQRLGGRNRESRIERLLSDLSPCYVPGSTHRLGDERVPTS